MSHGSPPRFMAAHANRFDPKRESALTESFTRKPYQTLECTRPVWNAGSRYVESGLPTSSEYFIRGTPVKNKSLFAAENHPVTEHLATRGLYLTSGLTLTEQQIDEDSGVVRKVLT